MAYEYKDVQFDLIVCSPLMRTVQTANIMNTYHNVKKIKDFDLIEIEQGYFTGKKYSSLTEKEKLIKKSKSKEYGMESNREVFERTKKFAENIKRKYPCKNLLIITHNCNASCMEDYFEKYDVDFADEKYFKRFKNAEIKQFDI